MIASKPSRNIQAGRPLTVEELEVRAMMSASKLLAISGDWDGDGISTTGLYDRATSRFFLSDQNSPGFTTKSFVFGDPKGIPITGDWDGDGTVTVGLYYQNTGTFLLRNKAKTGPPDVSLIFGPVGTTSSPLVGDWDGDGSDSIGVFDATTGEFHLKDILSPGAADHVFALLGQNPGGAAISGDWDGDGHDSVGMYSAQRGKVFLNDDIQIGAIDRVFALGLKGQATTAVIGDWDGDGDESVGLYDLAANAFQLKNEQSAVAYEAQFTIVPSTKSSAAPLVDALAVPEVITAKDVRQLLKRAAAASSSQDAIIAVVDRGGHILGVRVEKDVLNTITKEATLVFAIDGAVAKARTAAFFANDAGPLTSRTIRFISQSTVTQREVESNPNVVDPNSTARGPGFVAPIGLGGNFPPGVRDTPPVDLFAIEHTNRDSIVHPGADSIKGTPDDIDLPNRFNVPTAYIPPGQGIDAPESYGFVSGRFPNAQSRGIATLPGGIPLYKNGLLVGGIGVFFPGKKGFASYEQGFVAKVGQTELQRTNAPRVLEAEWIAFAAAGGSSGADAKVRDLGGVPRLPDYDLPAGRIDLVGITLEIYGPGNPLTQGIKALLKKGIQVGQGKPSSGANQVVDPGPDMDPDDPDGNVYLQNGIEVPEGWLVLPHGSGSITTQDVERIIDQGIAEAKLVRAAIRLKPDGTPGARTRMVFAVADTDGNVLGLYRMQDATFFSIDVAIAKARNTAYYADPNTIQKVDRVDDDGDGSADVPKGVAFSNRTFRFLAEPRYPAGVEGSLAGAFSILRDRAGINRTTAENKGAPAQASAFTSVLGFDAFNPGRNFRDPNNIANQNGIVFFPGSAPLYTNRILVGGFGVSGDGVDQDDVVTFAGDQGFEVPKALLRADEVFVRGVRLPYQKFLRNPHG